MDLEVLMSENGALLHQIWQIYNFDVGKKFVRVAKSFLIRQAAASTGA